MGASETELSDLHKHLTEHFNKVLQDEEVSAAMLNVIKGFLKDNEVTCQPEEQGVSELQERLNRKSKLASVTPIAKEA